MIAAVVPPPPEGTPIAPAFVYRNITPLLCVFDRAAGVPVPETSNSGEQR